MDDDRFTDEEVAEAVEWVRDGSADLNDILCLVYASVERDEDIAPKPLQLAVVAKDETGQDYDNGGADQVVWNIGADRARAIAAAWRAVGAIENADLLDRLASDLDALSPELDGDEVVDAFLKFRKRVDGPFFGIPEPAEELAEALVEWALERPDSFT